MEIIKINSEKYQLYKPRDEVHELEPFIKNHIKDIFEENCEYFPKQKMKTLADQRSIPDGFVVDFARKKWYVIEIKILCDDAVRRITNQITGYIKSIKNPRTRRDIYKSIKMISADERKDVLDDLINDKDPEIIIIIDSLEGKLGEQFKENVEIFKSRITIKTVIFKTFSKENDPTVLAHYFTPLFPGKYSEAKSTINLVEKSPKRTSKADKHIKMVFERMREGLGFSDAVKNVASKVGVRYATIAAQCTRFWGHIKPVEFYRKAGQYFGCIEPEEDVGDINTAKRKKIMKKRGGIPQKEYCIPILEALKELGGKGTEKEVYDVLEAAMRSRFNELDFEILSDGYTKRWQKMAAWQKYRMVKNGLLEADSPRGIWGISERGKEYLEKNKAK